MRWSTNAGRLGAAFMLGVAVAIWLVPVVAGPTVQRLRLERDQAINEKEALQAEVRKLKEEERKRPKTPTLRRVKVEITGVDQRVKVEAERRLHKQLTEEHVGRPIEDISGLIGVFRPLQGTEMEIDGVKYRLNILFLTIGVEMTLYGELSSQKDGAEARE